MNCYLLFITISRLGTLQSKKGAQSASSLCVSIPPPSELLTHLQDATEQVRIDKVRAKGSHLTLSWTDLVLSESSKSWQLNLPLVPALWVFWSRPIPPLPSPTESTEVNFAIGHPKKSLLPSKFLSANS